MLHENYEKWFTCLCEKNTIFKYADDATLVVPPHWHQVMNLTTCIKTWALVNKLVLNLSKTKVIVFRRPKALHFHMSPSIDNVSWTVLNVLRWTFIHYILSQWQCAQRISYWSTSHHGMLLKKLSVVAHSLIVRVSDLLLFSVSHFNFFVFPCGGLSWLPVSVLLHVKYTLSYRIVSYALPASGGSVCRAEW